MPQMDNISPSMIFVFAIMHYSLIFLCVINYNGTLGSFHVNSTNFWMFFHGPPRIVLKFGTVVEHCKKKPR